MNNTYPLNQNPIPQIPMTAEEHHRFVNLSIIILAIVLIMGVMYWWSVSNNVNRNLATRQPDLRAEVAAILRSVPSQVTQDQINNVAKQLSSSKAVVTDAQRQAVANSLKSN